MASITKDDLWKVFSLLMYALVLPLAAWVWNTNIKVAELQNDLGDAEAVIVKLEREIASSEDNSRQIIGIEKDVEYMKATLERIEAIVVGGRLWCLTS